MKITLTDPILRFVQEAQTPRVSIYYPTHRGGPDTRQDPIRLKNLMRDARVKLCQRGHEAQADAILRPIADLLPDLDFWRHLQEGLALFATPGEFRYFHLPYAVPEITVAADNFYLKPALPLFSRTEQFYILSLSKHHVKLYEANRYSIRQVEVPEIPESMAEALQFDEAEEPVQRRSFGPSGGARTNAGVPGSMSEQNAGSFRGQGAESDTSRINLLRFFRAVDRGLRRHLDGQQQPMILAGVERYLPIYHEANGYAYLIEPGVRVGVEAISEPELRERAWEVIRPYLNQSEKKTIQRFERIAFNNGDAAKNAIRDLDAAVIAAYEGRIDALVLPREQELWGEFDEETEEVSRESSDPAKRCELFDFAAMQTVLHGGEVFLVSENEMPPNTEVAALLRYSGGLQEKAS